MKIWTAQYRYPGTDRLDITVKGQHAIGKIFAPTWMLVSAWKEHRIDWVEYSDAYFKLMRMSYRTNRSIWNEVLARPEITLVCFCKAGDLCHRQLLARILEHCSETNHYLGERRTS